MPSLLHVGSGGAALPEWLAQYDEVRLDISPECQPDIVSSMTELGDIGPFDAIYCSHALEHLYPHEVPVALAEFRRVLCDGGVAIIFVPDLEDVRPTEDVLYEAAIGPICGLDLYYGASRLIPSSPHMAHHSGFTSGLLERALSAAGFAHVTMKRIDHFNLMAAAIK